MSDVDQKQSQNEPKDPGLGSENKPPLSEVASSYDGPPALKPYDTSYPPLNQYSNQKPFLSFGQRKPSAWLAAGTPAPQVPHPIQAPTPAGPGHLSHVMHGAPALPYSGYAFGSVNPGYSTPGVPEMLLAPPNPSYNNPQVIAQTNPGAELDGDSDDEADDSGKSSKGHSVSATRNGPPGGGTERARLRVNRACDRCRTHKVKCSGSHPCSNCLKHKKECVFRTTGQPPASQKQNLAGSAFSMNAGDGLAPASKMSIPEYLAPPQKKMRSAFSPDPFHQPLAPTTPNYESHALPVIQKNYADPSYTAYLENRVHYLENLLSDHLNGHVKNVGRINPDTLDVADLMRHTASKWRSSRRHQNALVIELCKALYEGLDPEAKLKVTVPRTQYFGWNLSGCNYLKPDPLPSLPDIKLLSEATKTHYVDFFFREINPLYAILHETVFREQIVALNKQANAGAPTNSTALFQAMLCLVYALSNRFVQFMAPDGPSMEMLALEERLFKYSHKVLQIFSFEWESFELIQCWLLVTLYLRITHRQTAANSAFGHSISMCRSMGLFRDRKVTADVSTYDLLKAKRIFFSIYCFDRIIFLQAGRYRALNEFDIIRPFPSFDYVKESANDDWITLPAFAMIHIARVANFLHTNSSDNYDLLKAQQINKEIYLLQGWLSENGFDDVHDIFPYDGCGGPVSHMMKAIVKLHFYDLLLAIHGKLLFSYFGKRLASEGMQIEKVVEANEGVIYLLNKLKNANCLYAPWYINLLLLFNVGINCLVLINAGVFLVESRRLMKESMSLLNFYQDSPVKNEKGKLVFHERFKMVKECIWVFKMTNKIMSLSFQKSLAEIEEYGTDPGSADVNQQYFTQFGLMKRKKKDDLEKLMEDQSKREYPGRGSLQDESSPGTVPSQPASDAFGNDNFLGNLQWFDQWLDFNQEL